MLISHVNHSSVFCIEENIGLLTDPWMFTSAFGGWYQSPGPNLRLIEDILSNGSLSIILLSHAHDDHIDEILLSKLSNDVSVLIPCTGNPGLFNRILNAGIKKNNIIEIDENELNIKGYSISCFYDGNLSSEDFIFLIRTKSTIFIHGNDNWRKYTDTTISKIQKIISPYSNKDIIFMSQIGIADSFPIFYDCLDAEEKRSLIESKIHEMCENFLENLKLFGLAKGYAYANQSKFFSKNDTFIDFDPYLIRDQIISSYSKRIIQLFPSDQIVANKYIKAIQSQNSLLDERLVILTNSFKNYVKTKPEKLMHVVFLSNDNCEENLGNNQINVLASPLVWNQILCGQLNLESILTGGLGTIITPKNYNMKKEYMLLVNWTYKQQITLKKDLSLPFTIK